jgi:Holliday junction resolvase RusA-like endonuclease
MIRFTILGEPSSKANNRRLVKFGNRPAFIKSPKALKYVSDIGRQAPKLKNLMAGRLKATARLFYASERPDLDPSALWDALQGLVYKNDRQIREMHLYHGIDKRNPRAEVEIEELEKGLA